MTAAEWLTMRGVIKTKERNTSRPRNQQASGPPARIPRLFSPLELEAQTGVPRPTWYTLISRGELPAVRIGRSVRVDERDAAAYIAAKRESHA